jgi:hypothetical protein
MRTRKYRVFTTLERLNNRMTRLSLRKGFGLRASASLETTGRRSGLPRQTPVGNGLIGGTFWLVAAHGDQADYVRNIRANPSVRVKVRGVWRSGNVEVDPHCQGCGGHDSADDGVPLVGQRSRPRLGVIIREMP